MLTDHAQGTPHVHVTTTALLLPADPRANYGAHRAEIVDAIHRVLESGAYILGPEVAAFEQEFARYLGVQDAVGVANGTDALQLALRAGGFGAGDVVLTVAHTAVATVAAIELVGALPLLVDIDPRTLTIDVNCLADTLKRYQHPRPKAVIPVHLYGNPADLPAIMEIARRHDLFVLEDCAQAHGAALHGKKAGAWGQAAAFSFYPTKNLGAIGDGGAVVSNDPAFSERLRMLRQYGWRQRYISEFPGLNSRLDEIQAAILRVKLKYLDAENHRRQELASRYNALLSETPLVLPQQRRETEHVYHQYVVRVEQRDALRAFLQEHGVSTLIHYPVPVHKQPAYQGRIMLAGPGLPATERACQEIVSLPMHPQLTDEQVETVGELIVRWHQR